MMLIGENTADSPAGRDDVTALKRNPRLAASGYGTGCYTNGPLGGRAAQVKEMLGSEHERAP